MRRRNAKVVHLECEFQALEDHVVAVFQIEEKATLGIRFQSPEQILEFMQRLMTKATLVWPDNPWVREYLSDGDMPASFSGEVM